MSSAPKKTKSPKPASYGHVIRHPDTRKITVFDALRRPIYTFTPERPEELTVVIETAPDSAERGQA